MLQGHDILGLTFQNFRAFPKKQLLLLLGLLLISLPCFPGEHGDRATIRVIKVFVALAERHLVS